jgi:hypothetical protein
MKPRVEYHYQPRITSHSPARFYSSAATAHIKPRKCREVLRTMGQALQIGRELLLAFWASTALAFCVLVIAAFVL